MGEKEKKTKNKNKNKKKSDSDAHFKPSSDVKGIRFGGQFVVKSFTVRRSSPPELTRLIQGDNSSHFSSTTAYIPTSFTILAHHAWHTLTLGLGTKNSKVLIFVFESDAMKAAVDRMWPSMITLGEVNRKLVRGLNGCEMARFKFRKGCLTFYVYAVRAIGAAGFAKAEELKRVLETVVDLKDFLDHTAMLAMPSQRSIQFSTLATMAY